MKDRIKSAFDGIHTDEALIDSTTAYLHRELEKRQHKNKSFVLPKLAGAFAAITIFFVGVFAYNLYFTADAYVSIDVNPSVELTLNRFDKVIATYAFNEDGERILSEANLRGKNYDEAAGLIITYMEADGYFTSDVLVSVTVQTTSSERERLLCSALQRFIDEQVLSVGAAFEVEVFPVSAQVWGNAHGCNMSPAKYMAIQELLEVDKEATIEDYSDSTIRQIRRRTQECHNTHNFESNENNSESTPSDDNNSKSTPSDEQGHGQGNGHGHGHRRGH